MHPDHELAQSMAQANSDASAAASSGSHYTSGTQNVRDNSFANSTNSNYRPSWSQLQFNSNSSLNFNHQPTDVSYHQQVPWGCIRFNSRTRSCCTKLVHTHTSIDRSRITAQQITLTTVDDDKQTNTTKYMRSLYTQIYLYPTHFILLLLHWRIPKSITKKIYYILHHFFLGLIW